MKKWVTYLIFTIVGIILFAGGLILGHVLFSTNDDCIELSNETIENVDIEYYKGEKYLIKTGDYEGEYDYQVFYFKNDYEDYIERDEDIKLFNTDDVLTYDEYKRFCEKWGLDQKYTDEDSNYMVISYASVGSPIVQAEIASVVLDNRTVNVYIWEDFDGVTADIGAYFIAIPVEDNAFYGNAIVTYTEEEFENIKKYGYKYDPNDMTLDKPIIYIYPEADTNVTVKLGNPEKITVSYPTYNNEWNVLASPNGNLKDLNTNKNYYGLYYEGSNHNAEVTDEGFVIKGEDTISFLEEKLAYLGLNDREINEFIIYWLPKMQNNKYNYIRFETIEEINSYMPLEITPTPDTIIRVVMDFKGLDEMLNVKEQQLVKQERNGYTVVEWGVTEIN